MPKREFLNNMRAARNLFGHPRVLTDHDSLNAASIQQMLAEAAIWLTPKSVRGFHSGDFVELGPDRLAALQTAINEFTSVANRVPTTEPATPQQVELAKDSFVRILDILQPYLHAPQEGERIERALAAVSFPGWVVNWDYELGSDADGQPAVYFNLFVDERAVPRQELGRFLAEQTSKIQTLISAQGVERWPYLSLRAAAEHKAG